MKKRIFIYFFCVIAALAILLSASAGIIIYNALKNVEFSAIRDRAVLIADFYNRGLTARGDNQAGENVFSDFVNRGTDARMTIIAPDGSVLLDNKNIAANMENHGDREEFIQALMTGVGEAVRYSGTFSTETYYYAIRLDDGNVLRLSMDIRSIGEVFRFILLIILILTALMLLISGEAARKLTDYILRPVIDTDLNNMVFAESEYDSVYEELLPYVRRINSQKDEINKRMAELKERADTMETITDNIKEGLLLIDKSGRVLAANKSVREIFNLRDISGIDVLHVCRDMGFQRAIKECLSRGGTEIDMIIGGRVYDVFFSPVYSAGEKNGAVILLLDITERRAAEKQRREFTANISHELKTPLTAISALSELIENGMAKDGDIKGFAAKINSQVGRLISIIDDIIKLSEFDEGVEIKNSDGVFFNIYELAASVKAALLDKANANEVSINITGGGFDVYASRREIEELLFNLIDNSIKYNVPGGIIEVDLDMQEGLCKISVSDTGIGIAEEHQARVFERFYRVDESRSKATEGTGLGLSIVKHIVMRIGGRIELTSAEGKGTTVVCYLDGIGLYAPTS